MLLKQVYAESMKGASEAQLAARLVEAKKSKASVQKQLTEANAAYDALVELLVEKMDDADISRFTVDDGPIAGLTISLLDSPYPKVTDKVALFSYFDSDPELRQMLSVNYQTLRGFCSEKLMAGDTLPPGVDVFIKTSIALRGLSAIGEDDEES